MAEGFEVIAARLLAAQMGVDTHITCCAAETLALAIGDVLLSLWVTGLLGHAKVHDVYYACILGRRTPNQKIVRLNVAVDEVVLVN